MNLVKKNSYIAQLMGIFLTAVIPVVSFGAWNCRSLLIDSVFEKTELFSIQKFPEFYNYGQRIFYRGFSWKFTTSDKKLNDYLNIDSTEYNNLTPQEREATTEHRIQDKGLEGFLIAQTWEHRSRITNRAALSVSEDISQVITFEEYGKNRFKNQISIRILAEIHPNPMLDPALSTSDFKNSVPFHNESSLFLKPRDSSVKFYAIIGKDDIRPKYYLVVSEELFKNAMIQLQQSGALSTEKVMILFEELVQKNILELDSVMPYLNEVSILHYAFKEAWTVDKKDPRYLEKILEIFQVYKKHLLDIQLFKNDFRVQINFKVTKANLKNLKDYAKDYLSSNELALLDEQINEILELCR